MTERFTYNGATFHIEWTEAEDGRALHYDICNDDGTLICRCYHRSIAVQMVESLQLASAVWQTANRPANKEKKDEQIRNPTD